MSFTIVRMKAGWLLVALAAAGCAGTPGGGAGTAAPPAPAPVPAAPSAAPAAAPAAPPPRAEPPPAEAEARPSAPLQLRDAQVRLAALGYKPGTADGKPGPRTRDALKRFQRDQGLPQTGQLDTETAQRLMAASKSR
jgi:hypothetical protein